MSILQILTFWGYYRPRGNAAHYEIPRYIVLTDNGIAGDDVM